MKNNFWKRLTGFLLTVIMLLSLLPATSFTVFADYEDGMECWNCNHYHWDEYCCGMCGACSPECTNAHCFVMAHCNHCGTCFEDTVFCLDCMACEECYVNEGWHCLGCGECRVDEQEELCGYCWFCADCMGGLCDGCGFCEGCWELELMHCEECGNCYGSYEICQFGFKHCEECCVICEQCEECLYEDGIELCDDCGLCVFCCLDNAQNEGCGCGEYCVENPDWYDHLCPDCGNPFCEVDMCEDCQLCLDCCEGNSECSETPPVCAENSDYEFHFCEDCGDCFHNSYICESCEATGLLLCETCCELRLESEGCDCSDRCISDSDIDKHIASVHMNADGSHSATAQNSWEISETHHWRACRFCEDASHVSNKAAHVYDKYGVCTICRFDSQKNILILKQPQSVVAKVTDIHNAPVGDPLHPATNTRIFTIAAKGTSALSYQWYYMYGTSEWKVVTDIPDDDWLISKGAKTNTLTISVPQDSCYQNYAYKCVITDTNGNQVTSNIAYLKAQHVRNKYATSRGALVDTIHRPGGNIGVYESNGHYAMCAGDGCEEERMEPHSFSKQTTIIVDRETGVKWVERTCTDCGFKGYILDHEHYFYDPATYECQVDTSYKNTNQHRLKCLWPGCTKTTLEAHDRFGWQFHGTPYSNADKVGVPYQECQICGYSSEKRLQTYSATQDKMVDAQWTQSTDLVFVEGGYASCDIVDSGTKMTIGFSPSAYFKDEVLKRTNPKITGWKVMYRCDRRPSGPVTESDVTQYFTFTKLGDELKWSLTVPLFAGRLGGGVLTFTPVIAQGECPHSGKTRIKGALQPICVYDGYTGDLVCSDCEAVIKYGDIIESSGKHQGKLTLIAGTAKAGTCEQRGYEGTFRCDHCNQKVRGKSTSKVHNGKTVVKNAVNVTCTQFGYSGDIYCQCGVLLQEGEILAPRHTDLRQINVDKASCQKKGYTGDWKCYSCNQIVKYGYNVTKSAHAWSLWGKVDDVYHRHTCVVAGCGAEEKAKHTDANRDLKCDDCGYAWGSDSQRIRYIAFNIDVPAIGSKPDYTKFNGICYDSDGVGANKKNGIQWFDVTDNERFVPGGVDQEFKEGHVYKVIIDFRTKGEYEFADEGTLTASINGRDAVVEYVTYNQFAGISYTFEALKHIHSMTRVNKVAPTCTTAGKNTYYHCTSCNKYYEDAAAKKQITDLNSWGNVAPVGHKESELKSNSTHHFKVCTRCYTEIEGSKAAHSGGTATCLEKAKCAACQKTYGELGEHDMETEVWRFMDGAGHAYMCRVEGCDYRGEVIPHNSNGANVEEADELCVDCGYVIALSKNHVHKSLNGYQHDAENHWGVCGCGIILDKEAHVNADGDDKCDVCGRTLDTGNLPTDTEQDNKRSGVIWIILVVIIICGAAVAVYFFLIKKKKEDDKENEETESSREAENATESEDEEP